MNKEPVTRYLIIARSRVFEEVWKMPAVVEPRYCSKDVLALHVTIPLHHGSFLLKLGRDKNGGWKSLHLCWALRAIVELTREQYLQILDDYLCSS